MAEGLPKLMTAEIHKFPEARYFCRCPDCGGDSWWLQTNKEVNEILGIECQQCGAEIILDQFTIRKEQ
jgi:transcription elongation factor Elf1